MKITALYLSPGHNYFGHHEKPAGTHEILSVNQAECVAGQGLRGDRFFGHQENYKGQITFFSLEVYLALCSTLKTEDKSPAVFRRNVITSGIDLNSLLAKTFELQGISFEGITECSPCYWMDKAFAPGAEKALKGQGGLRAKITSNGVLSTGPALLNILS
jgi:MOSC domain-containing protein YiiM